MLKKVHYFLFFRLLLFFLCAIVQIRKELETS